MQSKKCKCGFITGISAEVCKRCGTAFIDSAQPSAVAAPQTLAEALSDWSDDQQIQNAASARRTRGWALLSLIAAAVGLLCSAFNNFIGALAYPLAVACFLTGVVVSTIVLAKIENNRWAGVGKWRAAAGLAGNGVLLLVYGVAFLTLLLPNLVGMKWKKYVSLEGHYSIQLPGQAHEDLQIRDSPAGSIPFYVTTVNLKDGICATGYMDVSDIARNASHDQVLMAASRAATRMYGETAISEKKIATYGAQGIELVMVPPAEKYGADKLIIARIYYVDPYIYVNIIGGAKSSKLYRDRFKFLDSFKIENPEQVPDLFSTYNGGTSLIDAATSGELDQLKGLIAQGTDPEQLNIALLRAARSGKAGCLKELIAVGANVNAKDRSGKTALMLAAAYGANFDKGEDSCVAALINAGADLNAQDPQSGRTALMCSIMEGRGYTTGSLIQAGADVNLRDKHERTSLMHAASSLRRDLVTLLIARGAYLNARDDQGLTALARVSHGVSSHWSAGEAVINALRDAGASE